MRANEYSIDRHLDHCVCGADFDDIPCTCGYYESEIECEHDLERRMQYGEIDKEDIMPW